MDRLAVSRGRPNLNRGAASPTVERARQNPFCVARRHNYTGPRLHRPCARGHVLRAVGKLSPRRSFGVPAHVIPRGRHAVGDTGAFLKNKRSLYPRRQRSSAHGRTSSPSPSLGERKRLFHHCPKQLGTVAVRCRGCRVCCGCRGRWVPLGVAGVGCCGCLVSIGWGGAV